MWVCIVIRVWDMLWVIENVVRSVLLGIVKIVGFFLGLFIKFRVGKKVFKLMFGEVVFVLLDVFGEFFIDYKLNFRFVFLVM